MVLSKMSEAQLKTGHFGCYFMRFRFLFKLCVLLGLSVGADGPPHHRRAEVWELTRPPLQEGASQLLGVGGGLHPTGYGEGPDHSAGLPWNHLSGEGESCLTTTRWVWGSPMTLGSGGRVFPTQPLGCDPRGSGSVGMLSYNLARGSPQSALVLCWHGWGWGHSFFYGIGWNRGYSLLVLGAFCPSLLVLLVFQLRQNGTYEPRQNPGTHSGSVFSVPRPLASLSSLHLSELHHVCFIYNHYDMYVFSAGGIWTITSTPCLKLKLQYFGHLMWRADSLGKTLMLGKIEGRRRRGQQRMRWHHWLSGWMDMSLSKLWEIVKDREARRVALHGVAKSQARLRDWTMKQGAIMLMPGSFYQGNPVPKMTRTLAATDILWRVETWCLLVFCSFDASKTTSPWLWE